MVMCDLHHQLLGWSTRSLEKVNFLQLTTMPLPRCFNLSLVGVSGEPLVTLLYCVAQEVQCRLSSDYGVWVWPSRIRCIQAQEQWRLSTWLLCPWTWRAWRGRVQCLRGNLSPSGGGSVPVKYQLHNTHQGVSVTVALCTWCAYVPFRTFPGVRVCLLYFLYLNCPISRRQLHMFAVVCLICQWCVKVQCLCSVCYC